MTKRKRLLVNWLKLETEIRSVLRDSDFDPQDALRCIDEVVARCTGRGNSIEVLSPEERRRLENQYPSYFNWDDC